MLPEHESTGEEPPTATSWRLYKGLYTDLFTTYHGRDGPVVRIEDMCSCSLLSLCDECAERLARVRVLEVHRCILDLIYGKSLRFPDIQPTDMKILFLADLIYFADLYNILDIASDKIEQVFLQIEGLQEHYHNSPVFFVEVGYYLRSMTIFTEGLKYAVGKRQLRLGYTNLPDSVAELEANIRELFCQHLSRRIQNISRVLAFREHKERRYEKPHRPLTRHQLKIRDIAKSTLMNWVTGNILAILDLDDITMTLPASNWHKLMMAVAEKDVKHLHGISVPRLASRFDVPPITLGAAIKEQLSDCP